MYILFWCSSAIGGIQRDGTQRTISHAENHFIAAGGTEYMVIASPRGRTISFDSGIQRNLREGEIRIDTGNAITT
jgi:hypothetical protein